jgi:hypothetical protein
MKKPAMEVDARARERKKTALTHSVSERQIIKLGN